MSQTILGIEAGGTHTTLLITTPEGALLEKHSLGPGNFRLLGGSELQNFLRDCARHAPHPLAVGMGMAGVRHEDDCVLLRKAAKLVWPSQPIWVDHDLASALMVAQRQFPKAKSHVLVLSGTGSCCFGVDTKGKEAKCGGWGHHIGDRGSAYEIAHSAIRSVIQTFDQKGKWPKLGASLLRASMHHDPNDWIQWFQEADKAEVASLAVTVFEGWESRDPLADQVIRVAADSLSRDAEACALKLGSSAPAFVLAGSIFLKQPKFARLFTRRLRCLWKDARVSPMEEMSAWGTIYAAQGMLHHGNVSSYRHPSSEPAPVTLPAPHDVIPKVSGLSPTEGRLEASLTLDCMDFSDAFDLFLQEDTRLQDAIRGEKSNILTLIRWVTTAFKKGARLYYVGAGTSGRLGVLDASECPPTFGVPSNQVQGIIAGGRKALWDPVEGAEDDFDRGWRSMVWRHLGPNDVVLGIAASGRTPFVHGALAYARSKQVRHGLLCFNPALEWAKHARPDLVICPNTGEEILTGSTRLKAGTATKMILNMITTLSMVGIGKVKSNLMIDVQASNEKLRDRAVRMVATLHGGTRERAMDALERSDWKVLKACNLLSTDED
jgi:N-acetylmuramic acid 6-phosphate etherase